MKPFFLLLGDAEQESALKRYLALKIPNLTLYDFGFCRVFAGAGEERTFGERAFTLEGEHKETLNTLTLDHPSGEHALVHVSGEGVLACNDAFAREPLYFAQYRAGKQRYVRAISNLPEAFGLVHKRTISDDDAHHFVEHATLTAPDRTLYSNEFAFTGAMVLAITPGARATLHPKAAFAFTKHSSRFKERSESLRYLIDKSCRPLEGAAVALSGGLDASTLYASLSLQQKSPIAATLARRQHDDEGAYTQRVIDHYSRELLKVFKEDEDIFSNALSSRDDCYYPREDFVSSRERLFDRMSRAGASIAVTGHGADPLFQHGPLAVRRNLAREPAKTLTAYLKTWALHGHRAPTGLIARPRVSNCERPIQNGQRQTPVQTLARAAWRHTFSIMARRAHESGLRIAMPFLEPQLVSFALSLPVLPDCAAKEILRVAAYQRLPEQILRRPKSALMRPAELSFNLQGLSVHLKDFHHPRASRYLKKERFKAFDVTESQSIEKLSDGDLEKVYPALSFATWLRESEDWMTRHSSAC